jgi:hypothetical protein
VVEINTILADNRPGVELVTPRVRGKVGVAAVIGAVAYAYPVASEKVSEAAELLFSGAGLGKNSPLLKLRTFLLERTLPMGDVNARREIVSRTLNALKHFLRDEETQNTKKSNEAMDWWASKRRKAGLDKWVDDFRALS